MYDIVIVGAGPAGLTAAIYARRAVKKVLVLEAISYGGQIINAPNIENYPTYAHISGFDFATKLYNQAKDLGAEIVFEKVKNISDEGKIKKIKTEESEYAAKTVILANGSENRKLGFSNEDELVGRGVSYCATCDGGFYRDKVVAVYGGGNTALEDALYLAGIARKVYLIYRKDKFRGQEITVEHLKEKKNVEFIFNSEIIELNAGKKLESVKIKDGRGDEKEIKVDGLFVAIGRVPSNKDFSELVKLDDAGYVVAKEDCHTNAQGVFVAGDSRTKEIRQLVTATSDGAIAAEEAIKYCASLPKNISI